MLKNQLLSAFRCIIPEHGGVYISIPITTGNTFLQWYRLSGRSLNGEDYIKAHREQVILSNVEKATLFIHNLRRRHPNRVIVEPTSLEVAEWSQDEYLSFWGEVIEKFISSIYFTPGWNYSRGCAFEFLKAVEKDIEILDTEGNPITIFDGSSLIKKAVNDYHDLGLDSEFLYNITTKLDSISNVHGKRPFQR